MFVVRVHAEGATSPESLRHKDRYGWRRWKAAFGLTQGESRSRGETL